MRKLFIFLVLIVFVVSTPNIEEVKEKRLNIRKEFHEKLAECLLNSEASDELKKQILDNKEDNLRKVLRNFVDSDVKTNDKEIIRKCRKEASVKVRDNRLNKAKKP